MINIIQKLWCQDRLPIIDGLYKMNGLYYQLINNKVVTADLPQKDYSKWYSDICVTAQIKHQDIIYCCGEGSWGSDGYVIALKNDIVQWLFFGDLNPLIKLWINDNDLHVLNNCEVEWIIPIAEPERAFIKV